MIRKLFLLMSIALVPSLSFAQTVRLADIKGQVLVKQPGGKWAKAQKDMSVNLQAEIKTKGASSCALIFDKEGKNVVTIQRKTSVKIENVAPGEVFLSKGRVFALIKNKNIDGEFKVRTPTAVAGARGTGWETVYERGKTEVKVFDDIVFVGGLDKEGGIVEPVDVKEGLGVDVARDGEKSEIREIPQEERERWQEFKVEAEKIQEETQQVIDGQGQREDDLQQRGQEEGVGPRLEDGNPTEGRLEEAQPSLPEGEQLIEEENSQLENDRQEVSPNDLGEDRRGDIQDAVQENVREGLGEEVGEDLQEGIRGNIHESVQEGLKEGVTENVRENIKESVKEGVKEGVRENIRDSVQETIKENVKETVRQSVQETVRETIREEIRTDIQDNTKSTTSGTGSLGGGSI